MNYHNVTGMWPQIFSVFLSLARNSQTITVLFSILSQPEECTTNTLICYALCSFARSLADQHLKREADVNRNPGADMLQIAFSIHSQPT